MRAVIFGAVALMGCASSVEEARAPVTPGPQAMASVPYETGVATWYGRGLEGHKTASGEPFNPDDFTAAHKTLPLGSIVDVVRSDGRVVRVRINDRGPYVDGRIVDLSKRAAMSIGLLHDGVASVALYLVWVAPPKPKRARHLALRR